MRNVHVIFTISATVKNAKSTDKMVSALYPAMVINQGANETINTTVSKNRIVQKVIHFRQNTSKRYSGGVKTAFQKGLFLTNYYKT
ncbi:hypothetical protein [Mucilaginibacter flavidus]|uniref:hypothetical protein n=1 Tax=Mucilaginibacter flavidus TaxID=2949309 RepID=UPI0020934812|nr:hypothetical protein [Mucilaginibacter flavidus]MCO5946892.1 hypothetical protein [Mucilaginibacter flavidus]